MLRRTRHRRSATVRTAVTGFALAAVALFAGGPAAQPADAIKLYRDTTTGAVYTTPAEGREEYKPFGLDIGFQFYLQYAHELGERNKPAAAANTALGTATAPYNAFSATRSIVDVRRSFTKNFRGRLVLDTRGSGADYRVYVRHVYGEFDAPSLASTFTFGEIALPIVGYTDAFWGYRVQGLDFLDREGLLTSGDWGLGWNYKPQGIPIEWNSTFTNGEGRTSPELNSGKSFESRLLWKTPLDGLVLSGGVNYTTGGNIATPGTALNGGASIRQLRWVGQAFFKRPTWRIGATYAWAEDEADNYANAVSLLSNNGANLNRSSVPSTGYATNSVKGHGWSVMAVADLPGTKWSLLGRVDWYDPAHHVPDNEHTRYIVGPAYKVNNWMTVVATYEGLNFDAGAESARASTSTSAFDQSRILLQTEIKF